MIFSLLWGARSCELFTCGQAISDSLRIISEFFPYLDTWFEKGDQKPDLSLRVLPDDQSRICELLIKGKNRNDRDGRVIKELGYRVGLWNGNRSLGSSVSVQCGSTSSVIGIKNSFVFETPLCSSDLTDKEIVFLKRLISIWKADSGRIFELSVLQSGEVSEEVFFEVFDQSK